jgi:hypothetical protein
MSTCTEKWVLGKLRGVAKVKNRRGREFVAVVFDTAGSVRMKVYFDPSEISALVYGLARYMDAHPYASEEIATIMRRELCFTGFRLSDDMNLQAPSGKTC